MNGYDEYAALMRDRGWPEAEIEGMWRKHAQEFNGDNNGINQSMTNAKLYDGGMLTEDPFKTIKRSFESIPKNLDMPTMDNTSNDAMTSISDVTVEEIKKETLRKPVKAFIRAMWKMGRDEEPRCYKITIKKLAQCPPTILHIVGYDCIEIDYSVDWIIFERGKAIGTFSFLFFGNLDPLIEAYLGNHWDKL